MSPASQRVLILGVFSFAVVIALLIWWLSPKPAASPVLSNSSQSVEFVPYREDLRDESVELVNVPRREEREEPSDNGSHEELVDTADDRFSFMPPGELEPGSGGGQVGQINYAPAMRFPVEQAPVYANSQVYRPGGFHGPPGGQCHPVNYSYAWRDNFCETRGHETPMCPTGRGHQGQDIRPSTCQRDVHWAVAAETGAITSVGSYSVRLMTDGGVRYTYLHLQRSSLAVGQGDRVQRGQRIGLISNEFGGTPTTTHLHFEIRVAVDAGGMILNTHVPPYLALVDSYRRLLSGGA